MAIGTPDFRFRSQFPISGIANLIAQGPQREEQIKASQQNRKLQKFNTVLNTISTVASFGRFAQGIGAANVASQALAQKTKDINTIAGQQAGLDRPISSAVPQATFGQTRQGQNIFEQKKAQLRLAPETVLQTPLQRRQDQLGIEKTQAQIAKLKAEAAGTIGTELNTPTPTKLKGNILARKFRGESISSDEEKLIASELRDPNVATAIQTYYQNPQNFGKPISEQAKELDIIVEVVKNLGRGQALVFESIEAAGAAGLPKGTRIIIGDRPAIIE